jgi:D-aminoacyl-tRNA deacylase
MRRLLICSEKDIASKNIAAALVAAGGWKDRGRDGEAAYQIRGDDVLMTIQELHVWADNLDKKAAAAGFPADVAVFLSEHEATSGMPALTVHPIGNYHDARVGGRPQTLVKPAPALMSNGLRLIKKYCDLPGFSVCFEATHHGPYLELPTFFIEIGSDSRNWDRKDAAAIQARVVAEDMTGNDYPTVIGVGGGHYTPRFTELALSRQVNFAHFLPNYQMEGRDDEDLVRCLKLASAAAETKLVFLHRKSMNGAQAARIHQLAESAGLEILKTEDFAPLTEN